MEQELLKFMGVLAGDNGVVAQIAAAMASARVALKPASAKIQALLTETIHKIAQSPEADDDEWVTPILKSKWYRVVALLVDIVASVKLPTASDFESMKRNQP